MPRSRLLLLIWMFGVVALLGAWAHSLFRKSIVRYDRPRAGISHSLAVVAGSVEFVRSDIRGQGKNRLNGFMLPLEKGKVPGPVPDYKLGRFHHNHLVVGRPPHQLSKTTIEFPLWLLLILWTLACLPLYRRFLKRQRADPSRIPPPDSPR